MKYLMSDQTLFRDRDVFEADHHPEQFNYRDAQLREMAFAVRPALFGSRPHNVILKGLPGTGKTKQAVTIAGRRGYHEKRNWFKE